jgi:SAM-dependent methyltransferase
VHGLVCDARSIPLQSETFDIVTSQFGVEYAGVEAIEEAARLLAPGGCLALVLHIREGRIHGECAASLDAITRVQESGFIPLAIAMFRTGFAAVRGANRAPYEAAASGLAPAVAELESVMSQHGEQVAGDHIPTDGKVAEFHLICRSMNPSKC